MYPHEISPQVNLLHAMQYLEESIANFCECLDRTGAILDAVTIHQAITRSEDLRKSLEALTLNQRDAMRAHFLPKSSCPSSASSSAS